MMLMDAESQDCMNDEVQCVEYARRWLRTEFGLIYDDVEIAADIWDKISFYTRIADGNKIPVTSVLNGALQPPKIGDLIIYSEKFLTTGHVAVTCKIDLQRKMLGVSEQNYANQHQSPRDIRCIPMVAHADRYWLLDGYLIGWKQIQETASD